MLSRVLEPEVMDTAADARDYDAMDHGEVNRRFVADLLEAEPVLGQEAACEVLDLGAGTAQIPIELCQRSPGAQVVAIDLAAHMLALGESNVKRAGFERRIRLERVDAKQLPYADGSFQVVMSNSIVHHLPEPALGLAEAKRVVTEGGLLFIRDLLRPSDEQELDGLVALHAQGANDHQRTLFADSLRAALTLEEIREIAAGLGFAPRDVRQTSDRHWTWKSRRC